MSAIEESTRIFDLGNLLMTDGSPFPTSLSPKSLLEKTKTNYKALIGELMKTMNQNSTKGINYDKSKYEIELPEGETQFPREKPIPRPKPLTKWEKYRREKGLPNKAKRSRMVWDESKKDWVPRWGYKSIKHNKEAANWIYEEKPGEDLGGQNPFTRGKNERKLKVQKQKLREMKNEAQGTIDTKRIKDNEDRLKQKRKEVSDALQIAQRSTASRGNFDKKSHKKEPAIKLPRKRENIDATKITAKDEKEKSLRILEMVNRSRKSNNKLNIEKMVNSEMSTQQQKVANKRKKFKK